MQTIKVRGVQELSLFEKRVRHAHALGRINRSDKEFIQTRLDEIKARVVDMTEYDKEGEEVG